MIAKLKALWAKVPEPLKPWLKGLLAAIEGAVVVVSIQLFADPEKLCWAKECLKHYWGAMLGAALMAIRQYLRESPLRKVAAEIWDGKTERRATRGE